MVIRLKDVSTSDKHRIPPELQDKLHKTFGENKVKDGSIHLIIYFLVAPIIITIIAALIFSPKMTKLLQKNHGSTGNYIWGTKILLFFFFIFVILAFHSKWVRTHPIDN